MTWRRSRRQLRQRSAAHDVALRLSRRSRQGSAATRRARACAAEGSRRAALVHEGVCPAPRPLDPFLNSRAGSASSRSRTRASAPPARGRPPGPSVGPVRDSCCPSYSTSHHPAEIRRIMRDVLGPRSRTRTGQPHHRAPVRFVGGGRPARPGVLATALCCRPYPPRLAAQSGTVGTLGTPAV